MLWRPGGDDAGADATMALGSDDAAGDGDGASDAPDVVGDEQTGTGGPDACGLDGGRGNTIALGGQPMFTQQYGSSTGGTQYIDPCPPNEAVIGYRGFLTSQDSGLIGNFGQPAIVVGAIQTVCGALGVGAPPSNEIVTAVSTSLPMRGMGQDSAWTQVCRPNEVVVGFVGRSGLALDQIAFVCGHWTVPKTCDPPSIDGLGIFTPPAGGNGGKRFQDSCPNGQMAMGSVIRARTWIDAFGLLCGTPSVGLDGG